MLGDPESFNRADFGLDPEDHVPDLSVDPTNHVLTAINYSKRARCFHVTIEHPVHGRNGPLEMGISRTEEGILVECVALVLLVPPETMAELCEIDLEDGDVSTVTLSSDIVEWNPHPSPKDDSLGFIMPVFPLGGSGTYLVSQGCGGGLTHFAHPSTYHALDFECSLGTPVVAVASGVVVDVRQKCSCSGIHVSNLFQWNSITIEVERSKHPTGSTVSDEEHESEWEDVDESEGSNLESALENGAAETGAASESLVTSTPSVSKIFIEYVHIQASRCSSAHGS